MAAALAGLMMTACSGRAESVPPPGSPGNQVVFTVMSTGGMLPPVVQALDSPWLVIYGDGRVLSMVDPTGVQVVPARYTVAHVAPETVASFVSGAEADGLINSATDFGTPRVTDLPSTWVTVNGAGGEKQISAYAFDPQFETGLTGAQRDARARLRALIERAQSLAAGSPKAPYSPDHVVVYEFPSRPQDSPATIAWPGPAPESFLTASDKRMSVACGELTGGPAEATYRAALANPGARWFVGGSSRTLAVNPVPLPDACP